MGKSRNKKYRRVYPYVCTGCNKKRIAFEYTRAKGKLCTHCEVEKLNENQATLFGVLR